MTRGGNPASEQSEGVISPSMGILSYLFSVGYLTTPFQYRYYTESDGMTDELERARKEAVMA